MSDSCSATPKKSSFLPHIQGLRGVAILLVVLFHLMPSTCPCGYLGVDIFLVISGFFLIGKQLRAPLDFRFGTFVKAKVLRILHPVFATVLFALLIGIAVFPAALMLPANHLAGVVLLGFQNQYLQIATADYFSADTRVLPLMHLWYIGVLMQSYLLFGLLFLLWAKCRLGRKARIISLLLIGSLSLALQLYRLPAEWVGIFGNLYYCTLPRLWEFVLGGLLTLLPACRYKHLAGGAALLSLAGCVYLSFESYGSMPGIELLPEAPFLYVLSGALAGALLIYGGGSSLCTRILRALPLQAIGRVSFSLYLIHWPIICFAEYILCGQLSGYALPAAAALMALTTVGMWYLVEKRTFRLRSTLLLWLASGGVLGAIYATDGFRELLHCDINNIEPAPFYLEAVPAENALHQGLKGLEPQGYTRLREGKNPLHYVGCADKAPRFVIIGDSHAYNLSYGMDIIGKSRGWSGVFLSSYIVPFWGAEYAHSSLTHLRYTKEHAQALLRWLKAHPELHYVLIAQRWDYRMFAHHTWDSEEMIQGADAIEQAREAELRAMCRMLKEAGKEVIIFTDTPTITCPSPIATLSSHMMRHKEAPLPESLTCTRESYEKRNAAILRILAHLDEDKECIVLHREDVCFKDGVFKAYDGQHALMGDTHHLTPEGAVYSLRGVADRLHEIFNKP